MLGELFLQSEFGHEFHFDRTVGVTGKRVVVVGNYQLLLLPSWVAYSSFPRPA